MRSGLPWPLLVLIAGLGCGPSAPPTSRLETVIRLADHVVSPSPGAVLHTAVDVQHDGQVRRGLVSRPSFRWPAAWAPYGVNMGYTIDLPDQARAWNAVLVTREVSPGVRLAEQVTPLDGAPLRVRPIPLERERAGEVFVQIQPAVQLSDLDVETDPVQVPKDARLRFAISSSGLARSELADHRAFEARIVAFDAAGEHEVFSARIEVPRDEELPCEDRSVDIGALGGRSVRFRFTVRREDGKPAADVAIVWGEPTIVAPRRDPRPPVGVVLVSLDTLRARSVSAYGATRATMPQLDALAREGVLFENAHAPGAFTLPSHVSLLTGVYGRKHQAFWFASGIPADRPTLPEVLQTTGMATAAFTDGGWLIESTGFRRGFDAFYATERNLRWLIMPPMDRLPGFPGRTFHDALDWLSAHHDQPFFLLVHTYLVHAPYDPPPPYDALYEPAELIDDEGERRRLRYEQEARLLDDQLAAFLEGIDALGLRERTVVIVTSDHGEAFDEHGAREHATTVWDEVTRVPLVIRFPGAVAPGRRIAEPVSLVDVAPTIFDLLGVGRLDDVDGTSLLPLLTGAEVRLARPGVYTEASSDATQGWRDLTAIHTRSHSCIHWALAGSTSCWDEATDPFQAGEPVDVNAASEARAAVESFARASWAAVDPQLTNVPALDAEREAQLRALGYIP